jgi:serine/threonine-protein kinase RsbW
MRPPPLAATDPEESSRRNGSGGVRLVLPSEVRYLPLVSAVAEEFARDMEFAREAVESVGLSGIEASTHAIQHGNGYDPAKEVEVVFRSEEGSLVVTIRDEGKGFDPGAVPDPRDPANLLAESGRGIFICRRFMDEVDFEFPPGGGTTVRLVKRGGDEAGEEEEGDTP